MTPRARLLHPRVVLNLFRGGVICALAALLSLALAVPVMALIACTVSLVPAFLIALDAAWGRAR